MDAFQQKRLFCDSELVFDELVKSGLVSKDVQVFTRSFVVAQNAKINSVYVDEKLTAQERKVFKSGIIVTEKKLIKKLNKSSITNSHKSLFLQIVNEFQNDLLDAMLLGQDACFDGATLIAVAKTGTPKIDEVLRPCWLDWMAEMEGVSSIDVVVPYHNERAPRGDGNASIFDRIKIGGRDAILHKIVQLNWLPNRLFTTGKIGVVGQTELARDAVVSCLMNRHKPVFIEKPKLGGISLPADFQVAQKIFDECEVVLLERFSCIPAQSLRDKARAIFLKRLAIAISDYKFFREKWQDRLVLYPNLKCIISGYGKGPSALAMADCCREMGVRIAAFQHGITREILEGAEERRVFYETSFCDLFFTMNPMAAKVTKMLTVNKNSQIIATNWPSPFKRVAAKSGQTGKPVLFVSTNLYSGHKPNGVPPLSDLEFCNLEKRLVEEVFASVNKQIDYKPYPAIRQLDADPVIGAVNAKANMAVIGAHQDLRYLLDKYDMFITSKATSTVSWIVATGKPLVFIDHYCHARLSNDARKAFSEAFFLFDQSDETFEDHLREFLQRPMKDILCDWQAKSIRRSEVVERFFSGNQSNFRNSVFDKIKQDCLITGQNVVT